MRVSKGLGVVKVQCKCSEDGVNWLTLDGTKGMVQR